MEDLFDTLTKVSVTHKNRKAKNLRTSYDYPQLRSSALKEALDGENCNKVSTRTLGGDSWFDLDHEIASRSKVNLFDDEFDFDSGPLEADGDALGNEDDT